MKNYAFSILFLFLLFGVTSYSLHAKEKKIYVITSLTTLADFAKQIGKDKVYVESLSKGTQDVHYIEPRPSFVSKLRQADMVVINGLAFDVWINPLLDAARNTQITVTTSNLNDNYELLGIAGEAQEIPSFRPNSWKV